jgi:DNA polymerase III delta prime subunit
MSDPEGDVEAAGEVTEETAESSTGRGEIWIEKYRPEGLDGVVGHEHIVERLQQYVARDDLPHLMFAGPAGTGKTASATAIARELYGDDWQQFFLELNASDQRGIDVIRDQVKSFARTQMSSGGNYRIVFLDEADALCVPLGTEVVTGYPSSPEVKTIEEVDEDGEPIPSVDFETNAIQPDEGTLVDSGVADFFELELEDERTVLASLTHPFFVVREDGELVEKELKELEPGDQIADVQDDVGLSRCEICGDWTSGRFCSVACTDEGHSLDVEGKGVTERWGRTENVEAFLETSGDDYGFVVGDGELPHHEQYDRDEFEPALVSDGGRHAVQTVEVRDIRYSHRGKAYNISMAQTPNFVLANGILTHNTSDAQSALRRTMEQFSSNTRFILSCNYSSQIIDPIQSRCTVFRFSPLSDDAVEARTREIADAEGIELTDDGVDALVYAADGDMRAAINALQATSGMSDVVDEDAVYAMTSTARPEEVHEMVQTALDGDFTAARAQLDALLTEKGMAGGDVIDQLHRGVWEFELEDERAVRLLDRVGEADYRITEGANERIQLEALLASLALQE